MNNPNIESESPYQKFQENTEDLNKLLNDVEKPSHPNASYKQILKKARDSFMRKKGSEMHHDESLALESLIRGERKNPMKWPTVLDWFPELLKDRSLALNSVVGGLIVATVTIPQSMAYCTMVKFGVSFGVYSCTLALIVYSLLASSKQLSIGPLATTYMMMGQAIDGYDNGEQKEERELYGRNMGFMIGVYLIIMGILRLGFIENVFSQPIMMGYLTATGFLIIVDQIPQIFVIEMEGKIWNKIYDFCVNVHNINIASFIIGLICLLIFYFFHYVKVKYYPKSLFLSCMALFITIIGTALSYSLDWKSKYDIVLADTVPSTFPPFDLTFLSGSKIGTCWADALKISLVSYTASLLISKQLAKKYNYNIDATYEFYALGLGNFIGSLFTAMPAFGSLVRSPIIEITGAKSQLSGFVTGFTVIVAALAIHQVLEQIPITVISAFVIFSCSLVFGDLPEVYFMAKYFRTDFLFFLISFFGCVFLGLANGLIISIGISMLLVLKFSSKSTWVFHTFSTDEERLPTEEENRKRRDDRINTQNFMDELNEKTPSTWINNLRRLSTLSDGKNIDKNMITAYDICLCHDLECERRCHIMVINFFGYLNYYNVKSLKENADFLSLDVGHIENLKNLAENNNCPKPNKNLKDDKKLDVILEEKEEHHHSLSINSNDNKKQNELFSNENQNEKNNENENENKKKLEKKRGQTIRGIIFDCSRLEDMDITGMRTLKAFMEDMKKKTPRIFVKMSDVYSQNIIQKINVGKYDPEIIKYCERDYMSVLFRMSADILKYESELFEEIKK